MEAMLPFFSEAYGNPSSIYRFGRHTMRHVNRAREQVAALIGASPQEIYFTASGSESDNMALKGFFQMNKNRTRIITSSVEHAAIRNTARFLKDEGALLVELPVDCKGNLSIDYFDSQFIDENTIVSLMWANNETGVLFPIEELAQKVKERGGIFHTDANALLGLSNRKPIYIDDLPPSKQKMIIDIIENVRNEYGDKKDR